MSSNTRFLLIVAFFEGGAVMSAEVLGAKLIAPYYGNSLFVWAGALGITLAGLAGGYFSGSAYARKENPEQSLFAALLVGAVTVAAMPFITKYIVGSTLTLDMRTGIVLSCLALLLVPLWCFGMVSPLIIRSIVQDNAGRATGNVYAISTAGGILFTILMGFVLIPWAGLMCSAFIVAGITFLLPLVFFVRRMLNASSLKD